MSATPSASQLKTERSTANEGPPGPAPDLDMVWIPGGEYLMGSDEHYPEEAPAHAVTVAGFWIDRTQVTNAAFRRFVKATGYVTLAERVPDAALYPGAQPELLVAGSVVFKQPSARIALDNHYAWWDWLPGADWRHPEGPGSTLHGRERHPVLHVACEDVTACAAWFKLKMVEQEYLTFPALTLPTPHLINLAVDPKERKSLDYPYVHTWVETHAYHMLSAFRASVEQEPLIPLGAPLDYVPGRSGT